MVQAPAAFAPSVRFFQAENAGPVRVDPGLARCRTQNQAIDSTVVCDDPDAARGIRHGGHRHLPGSIAGKSPARCTSDRFRAGAPAALAAGPAADTGRALEKCRSHRCPTERRNRLRLRAPQAVWPGPSPRPQRPTRRALAFRDAWTCRSTGHRPARAGETRCGFSPLPERCSCAFRGVRSVWQGPSPLPQRCAGIRTSRGPKPPASARPARGGRFSPAGSGTGLRCSRTCRSSRLLKKC